MDVLAVREATRFATEYVRSGKVCLFECIVLNLLM